MSGAKIKYFLVFAKLFYKKNEKEVKKTKWDMSK